MEYKISSEDLVGWKGSTAEGGCFVFQSSLPTWDVEYLIRH
jgi:hypothetical protein